jgi:hypothetical protein
MARREPPPQLALCQAVHDACFAFAQTDLERDPFIITNWVDNHVPGCTMWNVTCKDGDGWRHTCILRHKGPDFDVERMVRDYDGGAPLPNLWDRLRKARP